MNFRITNNLIKNTKTNVIHMLVYSSYYSEIISQRQLSITNYNSRKFIKQNFADKSLFLNLILKKYAIIPFSYTKLRRHLDYFQFKFCLRREGRGFPMNFKYPTHVHHC